MITTAVNILYKYCSTTFGCNSNPPRLKTWQGPKQRCSPKCHDSLAHSFKLEEMGINHDMKLFPLYNDGFTLSNAEFNNKQLIKHTY